ncbi:hypothetical protein PPL_04749 [Heterostelium album PN500]|uniref:Uncharacterized protein n=1 Tax=Heterostelium pallidum (strain ATCC 26659 / Pp 5 / PN500) TaxID=670386 RepID=D3B8F6_HETP5|nr:hypothetical protein PPL_04749 [Heterostelium album PN500]EFA82324.1 hypothetical protein PPL_04749 [Heterostelium album PN500]|eukprot:XP_020434441.1 hypothetical protein PPL_04749 [Heterostelium album PN500]
MEISKLLNPERGASTISTINRNIGVDRNQFVINGENQYIGMVTIPQEFRPDSTERPFKESKSTVEK